MNERMKVRRPMPENWAGLHEEELKKVSGIKGLSFAIKGASSPFGKRKKML